jgi:hypothetical protein
MGHSGLYQFGPRHRLRISNQNLNFRCAHPRSDLGAPTKCGQSVEKQLKVSLQKRRLTLVDKAGGRIETLGVETDICARWN